jgi:hypothetical protein
MLFLYLLLWHPRFHLGLFKFNPFGVVKPSFLYAYFLEALNSHESVCKNPIKCCKTTLKGLNLNSPRWNLGWNIINIKIA